MLFRERAFEQCDAAQRAARSIERSDEQLIVGDHVERVAERDQTAGRGHVEVGDLLEAKHVVEAHWFTRPTACW
jgi:hypothetical protein